MKLFKQKILLIFMLSLTIFTGCDDFVDDIDPRGSITTDVAFATVEGLQSSVLGIYQQARGPYESNDACMYKTTGTDIIMGGTNLRDQRNIEAIQTYNANYSAFNGTIEGLWNQFIRGALRANIVLEGIENVDGYDPNNAAQAEIVNTARGECLFFRAFFHLEMIKLWDNVPLIDAAPSGIINEDAFISSPGDPDTVWALIVNDLETAIDLLPENTSVAQVSKWAALHLYSEVMLWRENWSEAASAAQQVIDSGFYELDELDNLFASTIEGENSPEKILSWTFDQADEGRPSRTCQQYFPLYDRIQGVSRTFEQGGRPWARLHPNDYYWGLFDEQDGRLHAWHKREWYYDDEANIPSGLSIGDVVTVDNITGGVNPLYITPSTTKYQENGDLGRQIGDAQGYKDITEFRLGETYLLAAEGYLKSNNTSSALENLNILRRRAYGDTDHDLTIINQDVLLEEHARELGHEGHRRDMLKRLGILVERASLYNPEAAANLQPHHITWPIPQSYVDQTGYPQNPNY